MGGDMGYRPNPDYRGSIFWFTVRLNKIIPTGGENDADEGSSQYFSPNHTVLGKETFATALKRLKELGSTKHILAAEDNIINQKVLVRMLHSFGIKTIAVVPDEDQAVAILSKAPNKYDLVLMDVGMPVMDGFEATSRIRSSGSNIPIIAMTANALMGYKEKCLDTGMDDYIPKPMSKKIQLQKLLFWLDRAEPQPSLVVETVDIPETPLITPSERNAS